MKAKKKKKVVAKKAKKKGNPQWPKGVSGNPKGRPKGAKNAINLTELKEAVKRMESKEGRKPLLEYYVERAYQSDTVLMDLMGKLLPSLRAVEGVVGTLNEMDEETAKSIQDRLRERYVNSE